ncbi:MAG: TIGR03084 family metal-binding protein [Acidimicrobiales bacterium]
MTRMDELLSDLGDEHDALDDVLTDLTQAEWQTATPAEGWQVRDQISHLAYFDTTAALALVSPDRFEEHKAALMAGEAGSAPDVALGRSVDGRHLLADWRTGRRDLLDAARAADPARRVPWYGPDMSLASFTTARLMETWAHGQDVRDALGLPASASHRLRHICHIGVSARRYAYLVHGLTDPGTPVKVVAVAPDGEIWTWGPDDAEETLTGTALGLALVFTQRRHPADTEVIANGATAQQWLSIAQAFAGPAGPGREPGLGMPVAGLDASPARPVAAAEPEA